MAMGQKFTGFSPPQVESLLAFIHDLLLVPNPEEKRAILSKKVKEIFPIVLQNI